MWVFSSGTPAEWYFEAKEKMSHPSVFGMNKDELGKRSVNRYAIHSPCYIQYIGYAMCNTFAMLYAIRLLCYMQYISYV